MKMGEGQRWVFNFSMDVLLIKSIVQRTQKSTYCIWANVNMHSSLPCTSPSFQSHWLVTMFNGMCLNSVRRRTELTVYAGLRERGACIVERVHHDKRYIYTIALLVMWQPNKILVRHVEGTDTWTWDSESKHVRMWQPIDRIRIQRRKWITNKKKEGRMMMHKMCLCYVADLSIAFDCPVLEERDLGLSLEYCLPSLVVVSKYNSVLGSYMREK